MSLKVRRDFENKINEHLYNNLYLLSQFYPTSADFNRIFKPDMFVKSNKAAFHEVVHYLLSILTPEQTKEKLTTWPPYDIQRETKFRTEVLTYMNELNTMFEYANIPHIMQSHLISPGGFKFTKFMMKLSELVVFEHLKKQNAVEFYCPIHTGNSKFLVGNLKKQTAAIDFNIQDLLDMFNNYYDEVQNKAKKIVSELTEINKKIVETKTNNVIARKEFGEKYTSCKSPEYLLEKIQNLHKEWSDLQPTHDLYKSCGDLLQHVKNNSVILEYEKDQFKVPGEIIHIIKNRDELDLIELFQGLNIILEHRALDPDNLTKSFIDSNIQKVNEMSLRYINLQKTFNQGKEAIGKALQELLADFMAFEDSRTELVDTTVLIPLININDS